MKKNTNRIINRYFLNQKFFLVFICILIILMSIPLAKNLNQKYRVDDEIMKLEQEIKSINNKSGDLNNLITYLESDQFAEEEARLKLGYKKPGEEVVVIKQPKSVQVSEEDRQALSEKNLTNSQRWWRYFFK